MFELISYVTKKHEAFCMFFVLCNYTENGEGQMDK